MVARHAAYHKRRARKGEGQEATRGPSIDGGRSIGAPLVEKAIRIMANGIGEALGPTWSE